VKTSYDLTAHALCPVDGARIAYDLTVTLTSTNGQAMIEVERLIPLVADLTREPVMQEPLTEALVEAVRPLAAGCTVSAMTVGTHSGVRVTCWAWGAA
jgi:hypothetical protein